jgi:hypothetical protein
MVAACFVSLAMNAVVINRMGIGTIVRNQIESNARMAQQLGPDGITQAVQRAESSSIQQVMTYAGTPVGIVAMLAILSGIYFGFCL